MGVGMKRKKRPLNDMSAFVLVCLCSLNAIGQVSWKEAGKLPLMSIISNEWFTGEVGARRLNISKQIAGGAIIFERPNTNSLVSRLLPGAELNNLRVLRVANDAGVYYFNAGIVCYSGRYTAIESDVDAVNFVNSALAVGRRNCDMERVVACIQAFCELRGYKLATRPILDQCANQQSSSIKTDTWPLAMIETDGGWLIIAIFEANMSSAGANIKCYRYKFMIAADGIFVMIGKDDVGSFGVQH